MAEAVGSAPAHPRYQRHETARLRRRRDDVWIAASALVAAMLSLPLAQSSWHGAEVAAVLAIAATSMLAGQRWAIAVVIVAELLLVPTVWPRVFLGDTSIALRIPALISLAAMVPGILAVRRGAAALVLVSGRRRTQRICRRFQLALVVTGLITTFLPLL
ncbi:MAG: hypothetical protein KF773_15510 [Deltaproteobacteria bacterium]|nr:hypothetical protein [Deltaproteobacteria bacterium]MCW5808946.1 hypothetical protein [Deltaproteobacteria bacterium]